MGELHLRLGDMELALKSFGLCIDLRDVDVFWLSRALTQRATILYKSGNHPEALADLVRCCNLQNIPAEILPLALLNLGIVAGHQKETTIEMSAYARCIAFPWTGVNTLGQALFNRGLRREQIGEFQGALDDYQRCLYLPGVDSEWVGRTLLSKASMHGDAGESDQALFEYNRCLEYPGMASRHLASAYLGLGFVFVKQGRWIEADRAYLSCLKEPGAEPEVLAKALLNLGIIADDVHEENCDKISCDFFTQCIVQYPNESDVLSQAYDLRGDIHRRAGQFTEAIEDYTKCIDLPQSPDSRRLKALVNRGICRWNQGFSRDELAMSTKNIETPGPVWELSRKDRLAIADFSACADNPSVTPSRKAQALRCRGHVYAENGCTENALADYAQSIKIAGTSEIFHTVNFRAELRDRLGDRQKALEDYTFCIENSATPAVDRINAYYNRGVMHSDAKMDDLAIQDYTNGIHVTDAPERWISYCYLALGNSYFRKEDYELAIANYELCLTLKSAEDSTTSLALHNRAKAHFNAKTLDKEMTRVSQTIRHGSLETDQLADSLLNRGIMYYVNSQPEAALVDFNRCINTPGASLNLIAQAHHFKGQAHRERGDFRSTLRENTKRIEMLASTHTAESSQTKVQR